MQLTWQVSQKRTWTQYTHEWTRHLQANSLKSNNLSTHSFGTKFGSDLMFGQQYLPFSHSIKVNVCDQ